MNQEMFSFTLIMAVLLFFMIVVVLDSYHKITTEKKKLVPRLRRTVTQRSIMILWFASLTILCISQHYNVIEDLANLLVAVTFLAMLYVPCGIKCFKKKQKLYLLRQSVFILVSLMYWALLLDNIF
ncbi:hypothetical protein COT97_05315 [Candidatus Falkowbacteria bacterium CG10_big_fil_rev_8_21_14_0_10_39_11]|uniref:Uncharacterized protein n=1 Tax=Candidatus Falkowbacteria bacterium CG10_big_fil_rev_8_21_14_0_10_39_11 TaxID=1974565 RepID=A0A2H0V3M3_9BACT|nr:MAG: hypothetical protein COT97_05315 [Candidatus Falkowbacteria bacterium CG10_big_fil_rev_8_21_14_0_10_39_11]